jgi:hypothetical protein
LSMQSLLDNMAFRFTRTDRWNHVHASLNRGRISGCFSRRNIMKDPSASYPASPQSGKKMQSGYIALHCFSDFHHRVGTWRVTHCGVSPTIVKFKILLGDKLFHCSLVLQVS